MQQNFLICFCHLSDDISVLVLIKHLGDDRQVILLKLLLLRELFV
jgi:hypothetical protein